MPKRLKFVVEQWVLFMIRRQTWQARRFEILESARHFQIESGRPIRISQLRKSLISRFSRQVVILSSISSSNN